VEFVNLISASLGRGAQRIYNHLNKLYRNICGALSATQSKLTLVVSRTRACVYKKWCCLVFRANRFEKYIALARSFLSPHVRNDCRKAANT
jgi:hypothetical protein